MKSKEELELKVLKHLLTSDKAINKAISLNIKPDHFTYVAEMEKGCYHRQIFRLLMKYFEESGGSLLSRSVLENRLVKVKVSDLDKGKYMLAWEKIQEQDDDPNEFYDLLLQLKQNLALQFFNLMFKQGHETMAENGLEEAVELVQENLDKVKEEMLLLEAARQNIDITEGADFFEQEYKKRRDHPEKYRGIHCGLKDIDDRTFGFLPGQLITVLAPSSGGKSVQLLNWAYYAHSVCNKNVLYFSFEMDIWLCMLRHLSLAFRIPYDLLKSITCPPDELNSLIEKMKLQKGGAYFEYEVNMEDPTPEFIDSRIRELINTKGKPDMVVVDYIGNMTTRKSRKDAKNWEKQGDAVELLFAIAKRYEIPVLTAQQVNREAIRETRKAKEAGKASGFWQDAASGDQRLMHYSYYVIGMEPDKQNKMLTYHPVKMRDAYFESFSARIDPEHNGIYELSPDEQENYRMIMGTNSSEDKPKETRKTGFAPTPPTPSEGTSNIYSPHDLVIELADEWDLPE